MGYRNGSKAKSQKRKLLKMERYIKRQQEMNKYLINTLQNVRQRTEILEQDRTYDIEQFNCLNERIRCCENDLLATNLKHSSRFELLSSRIDMNDNLITTLNKCRKSDRKSQRRLAEYGKKVVFIFIVVSVVFFCAAL